MQSTDCLSVCLFVCWLADWLMEYLSAGRSFCLVVFVSGGIFLGVLCYVYVRM